MPDRLISADALLKEAMQEGAYGYVDAEQIKNAPTVDAEPVRHGHWVRHLDTRFGRKLNDTIRCSCCGITFSTEDMIRRSYCPNCKAKMDEEEK